ncbi:MAG: FAD-dependent thymidylate synthase [Caldilineaceae bacterium]
MQVELIAYTQRNPALTPESVAGLGDLATIWDGKGTYAENVIEYAGRVCYRSTHRMGTASGFIADRVREGHEDIIEHVVVTVRVAGLTPDVAAPSSWRMINRHCEVSDLGAGAWLVSGNTRVWVDFFRQGIALEALPMVRAIAPAVFAEFPGEAITHSPSNSNCAHPLTKQLQLPSPTLLPTQDGPMRVTLLGYTQPQLADPALALHHGAAVFLFEGISRTCTHQLVRHRLASFSQESQRYVDLSKGGWNAIVPPAVAENPAAMAELEEFWAMAEAKYERLRQLGIRKEDARFLLPNAAETRIVASMNFAGWSHFLWLRAVDKAAQWEIRLMGQRALQMLHAVAPEVFAEQWELFVAKFKV